MKSLRRNEKLRRSQHRLDVDVGRRIRGRKWRMRIRIEKMDAVGFAASLKVRWLLVLMFGSAKAISFDGVDFL